MINVFAPSHGLRWENAIKSRQINNLNLVNFFSKAGEPIWSDYFLRKINDDLTLFIVGDFRFGNQYLSGKNNPNGIDKNLINLTNDRLIFSKSMNFLESISKKNVYFLFYDLACRESANYKANKYLDNDCYSHPTWNLSECESVFKKILLA